MADKKLPKGFMPEIAHITAEDGTVYQVLTKDGGDWDEAATRAAAAKGGAAVEQEADG